MGKSSQEKLALAEQLIKEGTPYRIIQETLLGKFGSGMSNTTLKRLLKEKNKVYQLEDKNRQLEHELALFKKMYFELLNATKKNLDVKSKGNTFSSVESAPERNYCSSCGSALPPDAKFCPRCGQTLE